MTMLHTLRALLCAALVAASVFLPSTEAFAESGMGDDWRCGCAKAVDVLANCIAPPLQAVLVTVVSLSQS